MAKNDIGPKSHSFGSTKVLAAINNPKSLNIPFMFLRNFYELSIVNTVPQLLKKIQAELPQIVLLSWNIPNVDVKKLRELIIESFSVKCIVIAEDNEKYTTTTLMNSGIPDFLLPPVSGQNIHDKIQALINGTLSDRLKKGASDIYLGKGQAAPQKTTEPIKPKEIEKNNKKGSEKQFQELFEKFKEEISLKKEEPENDVKLQAGIKQTNTNLAKAIKKSFLKLAKNNPNPITKSTYVSKVTLSTISCTQFQGYLICVSSLNTYQKSFMEKVKDMIKGELKATDDMDLAPLNIFEVEIPLTHFVTWIRNKADFFVTSESSDVALAFFSAPVVPKHLEKDNSFGVSAKKDLVPESKLDFDLYIHMPANKKFLKYIKKGEKYLTETYNKFISYAVETVYVRKEQKDDFLKYLAENFIKSTVDKDDEEEIPKKKTA